MIRNSSFAFFAESGSIFREIEGTFYEGEKCSLNMIEYLEIIEPYQGLRKNSPFKEIMKTRYFYVELNLIFFCFKKYSLKACQNSVSLELRKPK